MFDSSLIHFGRKDLKSVCVPTVIIYGKKDAVVTKELIMLQHREIKGSVLYTLENSAHGIMYDELERFNNIFLKVDPYQENVFQYLQELLLLIVRPSLHVLRHLHPNDLKALFHLAYEFSHKYLFACPKSNTIINWFGDIALSASFPLLQESIFYSLSICVHHSPCQFAYNPPKRILIFVFSI